MIKKIKYTLLELLKPFVNWQRKWYENYNKDYSIGDKIKTNWKWATIYKEDEFGIVCGFYDEGVVLKNAECISYYWIRKANKF